jgi:hypothetical protein
LLSVLHAHGRGHEEEFHPDKALVNANGWTLRSGGAAGANYDFSSVNAATLFHVA